MAEVVGGAILSASIKLLIGRLASAEVLDFFRGRTSIEKLLRDTKTLMISANKVLNDAERKRICDPDVKRWLEDLEDAIYIADDLLEEIETEVLQRKVKDECRPRRGIASRIRDSIPICQARPRSNAFDRKIETKLRDIFGRISFILNQRQYLGLNEGLETTTTRRVQPMLEDSCVYGRDSEKELLVNMLVSSDEAADRISVIPIVGMGGLGKTTLAQLVFDDDKVKEHFEELRVWVTVSDEFDVFRMTKTILERVTSRTSDFNDPYRLSELQRSLKEALSDKKFLLVLDDVWNENCNQWDSLRVPFESGASGSKIIMTTRNERVAKMMGTVLNCCLQTLSGEDSWKLFERHAFYNIDSDSRPDLAAVGRRIVEKCKGLPLAVKSLGGLLRSEDDAEEWEKILHSELWELPERESNILPALWLSYNYMSPHLKRCFAYSSIFPKDYEFEEETLILLWMAEDFVHPQRNTTMEKAGKEYFDELVSRSLFQKSSRTPQRFTMHDLVNDLATFVSGEFSLRLDPNSHVDNGKTRHLSYMRKNISNAKISEVLCGAENLRSLVPLGFSWGREDLEWSRSTLPELLQKLPCLRVLSLHMYSIKKLPDSIKKLKLLRYLDLSWNHMEEIPDAISTLYNLQTLLLSNCKELTQLPKNIGRLTKLRHLDIESTPLKEMPPHMGNMTDLQVLSNFVLGEGSGSNLNELGRLQHLQGKLCTSGLENISDAGDVSEANLKDKRYLTELSLTWADQVDAEDSSKEREVLEKLRPHTNLKKLSIHSYKGTSFPSWVSSCSFSQMSSLQLSNCKNCLSLPPLGQLLSLEELDIVGFDKIEEIGEDFLSTGSSLTPPFSSLVRLTFQAMSKWERWTFRWGNEPEGRSFPLLKKLVLKNCPRLVASLPDGIKTLEIHECHRLRFPNGQAFASLECLKMNQSCLSMTGFSLDCFPRLSTLELDNGPNLEALSGTTSSHLKKLQLSCPKLTGDLPSAINSLSLAWCRRLQFPGNRHYASLEYLRMKGSSQAMASFPLDHLPKLRTLHAMEFPNLESFTGGVFSCLEILILVFCPKLKVGFEDRFPALRKLKMTGCQLQESFPEDGKSVPNIKDIDIMMCGMLVSRLVHLDLKSFTSLRSLSINGYTHELDSYPKEGYLPTTLTSLQISAFPKLKALNGAAFRQLQCLETFKIIGCSEVSLLPEDDFPTSLTRLSIDSCPLLKQTYKEKTGNRWPKISHIPHVYI